jgi:CTP-dependent riboflavin kinase
MITGDRLTGIIFSDLGQASSFMALDWVQDLLKQNLGYRPFPATLNVRPRSFEDAQVWQRIRTENAGVVLSPANSNFCSARLYRVEIYGPQERVVPGIAGAILLPEVKNYPKDKIELVAAVRLKDQLGLEDGDQLILEFAR